MVLFILPLPGSLPLQDSCDRSTFNSTETISYSWPNKKKRLIAWTHSKLQSKHNGPRHDNKIFAAEYANICNSRHSIRHLKLHATLDSNYLVTVSMLNLLVFSVRKIYTELREMVKYYFADFVPFTDIPPKNFLQKVLKMVFFAQKTPVFGPKNRLRIWGVPPPSPFTDKIFGKKGVTDLGGTPPPGVK